MDRTEEFSLEGPENDGYGTIYFKDDIPVYIEYYCWNLTLENVNKFLAEKFGDIRIVKEHNNNGHCSANLEKYLYCG